jgi:tetratricopeptide (TPR) repeat protein
VKAPAEMPDRATTSDASTPAGKPAGWSVALAATTLVLLTAAVFYPIVGFEFVDFDVHQHVTQNPRIRGLTAENLKHIFTSRCITSYYPVRTLTFAIDHQIWGLDPGGFKLTNGLIHLGSVFLTFWLVLRLFRHPSAPRQSRGAGWDVCAATFSAGLFAVHPVVVEPVTWVSGREELLMTLGALGCLHFHLTARRFAAEPGRTKAAWACHAGAAFCCVIACFSSALAAVIPGLVVAWDLLTLPKPRLRRIFTGTVALWAIGVATIVIKRFGESDDVQILPTAFSPERAMLILNIYWLNLKTLFWPTRLALYYDWEYPQGFLDSKVILGGVTLLLTFAILWKLRRRTLVLFGLLWFGIALAPVAQIMPHHIHRADRFLYLPLAGLAVALALGLRPLANVLRRRDVMAAVIAAGAASLLLLGAQSAIHLRTWRTSIFTWEQCLWVNPQNARALDAFADNLAWAGRYDEAVSYYESALAIRPTNTEILTSFAITLAVGPEPVRDLQRAIELATRASELTGGKSADARAALCEAHFWLAFDQQQKGDFGQAIYGYGKALESNPDREVALFNLSLLLATCPDAKLRRPREAVRLAEQACKVAKPLNVNGLLILATAYAQAGQFSMAVITIERAIELAQATGNPKLIAILRGQRELYQKRIPPNLGTGAPIPAGKPAE